MLEQGTGEDVRWAKSEPIFRRIAELMNNTYAYKHPSVIDPKTGHTVQQANFTLPVFIHLLGNDLIDLRNPERTRVMIEVANHSGIAGVKQMQALVANATPLPDIMQYFGVTLPATPAATASHEADPKTENGVIIKGSSVQLDRADHPTRRITAKDAQHTPPLGHTPQIA